MVIGNSNQKLMKTLRTFIAADFPSEILDKIENITAFLKKQTPTDALKWVSADNQHLTLKFIGDLPEPKLEEVKFALADALRAQPLFTISVKGLGAFPNWQNPRVIWMGIDHDSSLNKTHQRIELALEQIGIARDHRAFNPHLTVARLRRNAEKDSALQIGRTLSQFKVDTLGSASIDTIRLYQSELTPRGPIYTPLLTLALNQV